MEPASDRDLRRPPPPDHGAHHNGDEDCKCDGQLRHGYCRAGLVAGAGSRRGKWNLVELCARLHVNWLVVARVASVPANEVSTRLARIDAMAWIVFVVRPEETVAQPSLCIGARTGRRAAD